jgi:pectate lyase
MRRLIIFLAILLIPNTSFALPAFPGAEGWGSDTIGGRSASAKLCKVTTLSDATSGSCNGNICSGTFRYCASQHNVIGPKIIIFTVGGTITEGSNLIIREPFTTIAGQTAPGGGILIRGPSDPGVSGSASIIVATHDVVIRGLRLRDNGDSGMNILGDVSSFGPAYNVVVDHNSLSWDHDSILGSGGDSTQITYSYNIFSESTPTATGGRQGVLISAGAACNVQSYDISFHHNLLVHNRQRNPLIKHDVGRNEIINNVVYNFGYAGIETYAASYIAKNVLIKGPNDTGQTDGIRVGQGGECPSLLQPGTVMVTHNINRNRPTDTGDDWLAVDGGTNTYRTDTAPFTLWGNSEDDVATVKAKVLAGAGATVPSRDSVDTRIITEVSGCSVVDDYANCPGGWIDTPSDVGGWPTIASGSYPTDTDGDGMPDAWESLNGTDPNVVDWNGDLDGDGYLNIEEYINSFFEAASGDETPPDVVNQSPAPDVTGWLVTDRDVSFDVTDATGVDSNIDGATNKTCAVGLTCTPAGDPTSLNVVYNRGADWNYEQTYTANIAVDDTVSPANSQSTNWQFTTEINPDIGPPVLGVHSPSTGQTGWIITNRLVTFDITDDIELVDTSVQFNVDGGTTQICGAGLTCSWIVIGKHLHLEYTHGSDWAYETSYTINIPQALDTSSNNLNTSWGFSTESAPPPPSAPSDIEIHIEDP